MLNSSLVKDIFNPQKMHSLVINENESVVKIIKTFAEDMHLKGIFVINDNKKFMGVITRNDLLVWAKYRLGSGIKGSLYGKPKYDDINRYVFACKINEMIHINSAQAYVKIDDDLSKALELMLDSDLIDVPVLNEEGMIIGDLKLSEILLYIINSNPRQ